MTTPKFPSLNSSPFLRGIRSIILPILLLSLATLGFLAGCQLQNLIPSFISSTQSPTIALESATTSVPAETSITPTTPANVTTLVLWVPPEFDPNTGTYAAKIFKERIASFQQEHSNLVVEVRLKALDGRGGLLDSITTASLAASKALPALVALSTRDMENAALKGLLLPLDNAYKNYEDPDWLPYASQLSLKQGSHYGVPFAGDVLVMAYRPLQSPYPPTTWQELALQDLIVTFPVADSDAITATTMYLTAGGKLKTETGAPILQKTPLLKSFAILNDGTQTGAFPFWIAQFTTFDQSWSSFVGQQAGYSINWISQYLKNPPANISVTAVPKISGNQVTLAQGWSWCIPNQSSEQQQYSILLMNYLSDAAFINTWNQAAGYVPVRKSGFENWKGNVLAPVIIDLTANAQALPSSSITHITSPILKDSMVEVIKLQTFYQQVVEDAVNNFQE